MVVAVLVSRFRLGRNPRLWWVKVAMDTGAEHRVAELVGTVREVDGRRYTYARSKWQSWVIRDPGRPFIARKSNIKPHTELALYYGWTI